MVDHPQDVLNHVFTTLLYKYSHNWLRMDVCVRSWCVSVCDVCVSLVCALISNHILRTKSLNTTIEAMDDGHLFFTNTRILEGEKKIWSVSMIASNYCESSRGVKPTPYDLTCLKFENLNLAHPNLAQYLNPPRHSLNPAQLTVFFGNLILMSHCVHSAIRCFSSMRVRQQPHSLNLREPHIELP
jgi:hypothetical protein